MYKSIRSVIAVSMLLSGCATVFSSHQQSVTFNTVPPEATVRVNGKVVGVTPLTVDLDRDGDTVAVLEKSGYRNQIFPLRTHINPLFWGDVILLSPIGMIVDASDHTMVAYEPDHYEIRLTSTPDTRGEAAAIDPASQVTHFIGTHYDELGQELVKGNGALIDQLVGMLGVSPEDNAACVKILRDMYTNISTAPHFSAAVIDKFGLKGDHG